LVAVIRSAFTEATGDHLIGKNSNYFYLILAIMIQETGLRYHKKILPYLPIPETWLWAKSDGIMQATNVPNINFYLNLVYNIKALDKIVNLYVQNRIINDKNVRFISADWCAGMYSCKIAALQQFLNSALQNQTPPLNTDGIIGKRTTEKLARFNNSKNIPPPTILKNRDNIQNYEKYRENFIKSSYYKYLVSAYPEIKNPIVSNAEVKDLCNEIRNILSFDEGWLTSKEYSEKVLAIYKQLKNN
jgi:hypothetical protein